MLHNRAVHAAIRAVPAATAPPPLRFDVEGVLHPHQFFGNERTFAVCQHLVQNRLSEAVADAYIARAHATTTNCIGKLPLIVSMKLEERLHGSYPLPEKK